MGRLDVCLLRLRGVFDRIFCCKRRKKNVLDKLNYAFINKLITGDQAMGKEGAYDVSTLQLAAR